MDINTNKLTVGELLTDGKIYTVPLFQRSYSWEKEHITDFWEDLINLYEKKTSHYFIGSMVFTPHRNPKKIKILDGQQRFATLLLFLAALRDVLHEIKIKGSTDWIDEINRIIFFRDIVSRSKNPKLELNREDKSFFEKVIINGIISDKKYNSHKLITESYNFFKKNIREKIIMNNKFIEGSLDIITNRFLIIKIEADSDIDAHMIFETLNDRGLDLSVADLFKNYIFSIAGSSLDEIAQLWKEMVDSVGDHNITKFLRHYCNSKLGLVRKEELYKKLSREFKKSNVKALIEELNKESEIYSNLNNPTSEFWNDKDIEYKLEEMNILKAEQAYTLLLSAYVNLFESDKSYFKKILESLLYLTFRYSTICRLNPNDLERTYSKLAIKLRKGDINSKKTIKELKKLSPSKDTFIESFKKLEIKISKVSKYILLAINNHLMSTSGKREITTNIDNVNLEHIIPKNPDTEWKEFFTKNNTNYDQLIHKIGNMTILLKEYNNKLKNKFYDQKKEMYKKSVLPLNDKLNKYEEFSIKEVEERQTEMAQLAEILWRV